MSELQAAVLAPQLEKLAERNAQRRSNVQRLLSHTAGIAGLTPVANLVADTAPSYYKLAWLYDSQAFGGAPVEQFIEAAKALHVPLDTGFRGFARRSVRRCRPVGQLPHSQRAAEATVVLHHPILLQPPGTMDFVAQALREVAEM
jgi:dTDP-4-amino-4,6-dideoxygalactose transaminase